MTLRELQTMMMMTMNDARDNAAAYLDVLRAYDDDDAAVTLTGVKESVISAKHTHTHTNATNTRQFAACRYSPASRELGAKRRPAETTSLCHRL
jgi:hypothetical protein